MRPAFGKGFTRYCNLIVKLEHVSDLSHLGKYTDSLLNRLIKLMGQNFYV